MLLPRQQTVGVAIPLPTLASFCPAGVKSVPGCRQSSSGGGIPLKQAAPQHVRATALLTGKTANSSWRSGSHCSAEVPLGRAAISTRVRWCTRHKWPTLPRQHLWRAAGRAHLVDTQPALVADLFTPCRPRHVEPDGVVFLHDQATNIGPNDRWVWAWPSRWRAWPPRLS